MISVVNVCADIKKSYVDVFNPGGGAGRAPPPPADVLGPSAPLHAPTNYFVPAPAPQVHATIYFYISQPSGCKLNHLKYFI